MKGEKIMNTPKITKRDHFNAIISVLNGGDTNIDVADLIAFCEKEVNALDTRAVKSRERAAAKRAEGDALTDLVFSVLTDEPATRAEVFERVVATGEAPADVTVAKIGYRLTSLCGGDEPKAVKSEVAAADSNGKSRKLAAYSLA